MELRLTPIEYQIMAKASEGKIDVNPISSSLRNVVSGKALAIFESNNGRALRKRYHELEYHGRTYQEISRDRILLARPESFQT